MTASVQEAIQARVYAALLAGATAAASRVFRGRPDALAPEEVPAINVRRSNAQNDAFGSTVDRSVMEFELDFHVRGDDWETTADALHMQAHTVLSADAQMKALCRVLRCIRTEPNAEPGDKTLGRITATYQAQALVRVADLTHLVN